MITENLLTLKIHKLSQAQYERELRNGTLDPNALYLTPEEEIDLTPYAIESEVSSTYETKTDASNKLTEAKTYADNIKNDLLNGAGEAYDSLKELGELIDENHNAIDALEIIATGKMGKENPTGTGSFSLNRKPDTVIGDSSHAEGYLATASGYAAHAEGEATNALGSYSHAEGYYTNAKGIHQHVQGKYNLIDENNIYAHIVGNGTSEDARSNAHTLDWDGNAWFAGNITLGPDNKEVATKEDLENIQANFKTVAYENTVYAVQDNQTIFEIGIETFDAAADKLDVHDGRLYLTRNLDYTVSGQTVALTEGINTGDSITFTVLKNVPVLDEEITVSPSLLEENSIPLSKLESMPTADQVGTYTKAEVDAIVAAAVAAAKEEIMASLKVTADVPIHLGISADGGLTITYDDGSVTV